MKNIIRKYIDFIIPEKIRNYFYFSHPNYKKTIEGETSFSQEGEDMVLKRIFKENNGFFIDIGAHHPYYYSNTNYFYQKGWRGINIDPTPGSMKAFKSLRPEDVNIEVVVSSLKGQIDFYLFNPSLMNTISKSQFEVNQKFEWCKFLGTIKVDSLPLSQIIKQYSNGQKIDFISIDVEGAELEVLKSNDWELTKPNVLLIEIIDKNIEDVYSTEVYKFLKHLDYNFFAKTGNTCFFKKNGFFEF